MASQERVDALFHLGDIGRKSIKILPTYFPRIKIYVVPGNHDRRRPLYQMDHEFTILDDLVLNLDGITVVAKSLGRVPIALGKYRQKIIELLHLAKSFGKRVLLLSHCGGKIACHRRFLQKIEGGHAEALRQITPDVEIHGHKHPSIFSSSNKSHESDTCWNAAFNLLIVEWNPSQIVVRSIAHYPSHASLGLGATIKVVY